MFINEIKIVIEIIPQRQLQAHINRWHGYMKICSMSLVRREVKSKLSMSLHCTLNGVDNI